jgi:acyl-CoA reductase-like NAD-dependent aldehyde dehydrogenase
MIYNCTFFGSFQIIATDCVQSFLSTSSMRDNSEENFGPVAPLSTFKTAEKAIIMAIIQKLVLQHHYLQQGYRLSQVREALEYGNYRS